MLSLYSSLSSARSGLRSIVKSGLQLFYKTDITQAPLGEEQVRNNSFNELGSEEVNNGDFATDLSNWTIAGSDSTHTVTHTSNGARFKSDTTDPTLTFTSDTANIVSGKSYQIKVVISEYQGSSGIKIQSSATGNVKYLFDSVDTFTYNFTAVSDSSTPIQFYRDTENVDITIKSVSLKELDPNDRWTVSNDTPSEQTVQIREGSFFIEYDSTATKGAANINVPLAGVANQEYEIKVVVDSINNDEKLKVQLGDSAHNLSVGVNIFKATSTSTGTLTLGRTHVDDSVTATVSSVSLRAITNSIKDNSRNSNDGTLYSGKALDFDGTGDSVTVGDTGIDMKTVAFWIFVADVTSNTEQIMEFKTDHGISSVNGTITTAGTFTNKVIYVNGSAGSSISASTWSRIVITTTAAIDVNQLVFGTDGSSSGTFVIADFQLYDKTWTASDVEFDYNNPDKDVFDNSNSSIVVTDCKSLLRLNEGTGDRVYDAAPVLGAEKVINTNFESNTGFSEGTGWNINNNLATHTGSTGNLGIISSWVSGASYKIVFTIDVIDDGVCNVYDSSTATTYASFDTDGTKTLFIKKDSTGELALRSSSSNCEISFLSVKEIKPSESFAIVGDKNFIHQQPYIPQYAMSSFSKKMLFDGSNDYVNCASDASIDNIFSGGGTFSAWISPTTDGGENLGTIMGKGTVSIRVKDDDNDGVILNLAKGFDGGTNADFLTSDEVVLENKMNHIAITYNDSASSNTPLFYVNGVLKAIDTNNSTTPVGSARTDASSNLIIGNVSAGGSRSFDGIIDEVSLFDVELTQAEVVELFNSGSAYDSTTHSQSSNLNAYWRNNGADKWDDLSTNTNHGTVSGSPTEIFLQEVPFFGKDSLGMFMNKPRLGGLNFNKSGYVETGSTFQSTFRDSFSICFWFKFPDGQPSSAMRFLGHDVGDDELFISLETNGESKFQFRSNADRVISRTDAAIASNNQTDWIYLTITLTKASTIGDAQIIFYKDGSAVDSSLVGTETLTQANMEAYTQTQNLVLGAFRNDQGNIGADTCDGIIDDFKIYSKALTAAEIKKNYNATKGRHKN